MGVMAKIAYDFDIEYTTVKVPLDIKNDGPGFPDLYLYVRNKTEFPENFDAKDKYLAMELMMWGECEEKPRKRVIEFLNAFQEDY